MSLDSFEKCFIFLGCIPPFSITVIKSCRNPFYNDILFTSLWFEITLSLTTSSQILKINILFILAHRTMGFTVFWSIVAIKLWSVKWLEHMPCVEETRNTCRVLWGNLKQPLKRSRHRKGLNQNFLFFLEFS